MNVPVYTELVPVNHEDLDSPTVIVAMPALRVPLETGEYYLPTAMVPLVEKGLEELERGDQRPLIECSKLFALWFNQHYPDWFLDGINHYVRARVIWFHNDIRGEVDWLEIAAMSLDTSDFPVLHTVAVSGWARLLTGPHAEEHIDALGDQFFGEHHWQQLKRWLTSAQEEG